MIRPDKKHIAITTDFQSNPEVFIYHNELIQVFINILKNAIDNFVDKNTQNPKIDIGTKQDSKAVVISISDNGGGIPEEILENVFDPYFSTKDEKNGTGLGLYISKLIIEEHNHGALSVVNRDEGASFLISLPVQN